MSFLRTKGLYGIIFFLHSTDSTYSFVPGDEEGPFFSDRNFWGLVSCTNWCTTICITCPILRKIECNEFVCNKFVLVLVQIDLIQFENSNSIRSVCTKFDTNLLHTNLLHSILRKNWTILRKMGHVIQIVVHQFVRKTSAKKKSCLKKIGPSSPPGTREYVESVLRRNK
jgi:hypothetical protein